MGALQRRSQRVRLWAGTFGRPGSPRRRPGKILPRYIREEQERQRLKKLQGAKTYPDGAETKAVNCLGTVKSYDPEEGLGWIEYGRVGYEIPDIWFTSDDIPPSVFEEYEGVLPAGMKVEFNMVNSKRPGYSARDLVFPTTMTMMDLGLSPEVCAGACNALGRDPRDDPGVLQLINPAPVQLQAIPKMLKGEQLVIAAETGSGKSLAYMLPLVEKVWKLSKLAAMNYGFDTMASSPVGLVVCPTRELALQACRTLKLICQIAKCRVRVVHGGAGTYVKQRKEISQLVDILVATPDRLLKLYRTNDIKFSDIQYIAIDEADFMLTQGFADLYELLGEIDEKSKYKDKLEYTLVTASITKPLQRLFQDEPRWQHMKMLESRSLHRPQSNCSHTFILTKGRDKIEMLISLLRPEVTGSTRSRQTLVFCNTVMGVRSIGFQLQEAFASNNNKRYIGVLHKDMDSDERQQALRQFALGDFKVLICSDIAQRGLDIPTCGHVVNFDFPLNSVDYLHRSGRTARYGEQGKVTSLVKKGDKYLARAIERSCQLGRPINDLSGDKRDYLRGGALHHILEHQPRAPVLEPGQKKEKRPQYAGGLR